MPVVSMPSGCDAWILACSGCQSRITLDHMFLNEIKILPIGKIFIPVFDGYNNSQIRNFSRSKLECVEICMRDNKVKRAVLVLYY